MSPAAGTKRRPYEILAPLVAGGMGDYHAVPFAATEKSPQIAAPEHLFQAAVSGVGMPFDVSIDGKRLLVNRAETRVLRP